MTKMDLPSSKECCGCSACFAACPKKAIAMLPDAEGFLQPKIDTNVCVGCGKCTEVCPVLHSGEPCKPVAVYAAKAKDDELRKISSSGGVFSLLARDVLEKGGVVFGAAFEKGTHRVIHKAARNEGELDELRGSKYVQSDMGRTFCEVRDCLQEGKEVLFSGCPCQVAGLRTFLGKDFSNLLCVDVICHGVPSPLAWLAYLHDRENKEHAILSAIYSRRNCSWRAYGFQFGFNGGHGEYFKQSQPTDFYLSGFVSDLFNRNSCNCCQFRSFKSRSDATIGDYWGIEYVHPQFSDDVGVSAVVLNTTKGVKAFESVGEKLHLQCSKLEFLAKNNKAVFSSHKRHPKRDMFFKALSSCREGGEL